MATPSTIISISSCEPAFFSASDNSVDQNRAVDVNRRQQGQQQNPALPGLRFDLTRFETKCVELAIETDGIADVI